jgi:hypothetical protein
MHSFGEDVIDGQRLPRIRIRDIPEFIQDYPGQSCPQKDGFWRIELQNNRDLLATVLRM